jgi:hypothetical protein
MTYLRDGCVGKCNSQSFLSGCGVSPYVHAVQYMCMPQAMGVWAMKEPTRNGMEVSNIVRGTRTFRGGTITPTLPAPPFTHQICHRTPFQRRHFAFLPTCI